MPKKQRLDFYTLDYNSRIQTLKFPNVNCEDGQWHKIHFSVLPDRVTLYLNCNKQTTLPINIRSPINVNGDIWLAKYEDDLSTVPVCHHFGIIFLWQLLILNWSLNSSIFNGWLWAATQQDLKENLVMNSRYWLHYIIWPNFYFNY